MPTQATLRKMCITTIIKSKKSLTVKTITAKLDNKFTIDQVRKSLARCAQEGLLRVSYQDHVTKEKFYIMTLAGRALVNDEPIEKVSELKTETSSRKYAPNHLVGAGKCLLQELWKGPIYQPTTAQT